MKKSTVLIIFIFFFQLDLNAQEYHVTTTGNDSNPGTLEAPFLTISAAAKAAYAGDEIIVNGGIYREQIIPPRSGESESKRIIYSATKNENPSLYKLAQNIRPDFLLGSYYAIDSKSNDNKLCKDFFTKNFNILTMGVYMRQIQPLSNEIEFERMDEIINYATSNNIKVYLHPMFGGWLYTADWVNNGNFTTEELSQIMRDRITRILTRYKGKIDYIDVVNEALIGNGIKEDGTISWQETNAKGEKHVWMQTMGMYKGEKHYFPKYLVDAFRICREVAGPDVKLILNEWANETAKSSRAEVFFHIAKNMREDGIPIDGVGMQLHLKLNDGILYDWEGKTPFDFEAFDEQLAKYEKAGMEVHITEFDIHLKPDPIDEDFQLQGKYYAEIVKHALKSPIVKSLKTWGFTDRYSWKAAGKNGHPLMLDENLATKPAYTDMVEMLKSFYSKD